MKPLTDDEIIRDIWNDYQSTNMTTNIRRGLAKARQSTAQEIFNEIEEECIKNAEINNNPYGDFINLNEIKELKEKWCVE